MKNEIFKKVTTVISSKMGRTGLKIQKYAPEISLGAGLIGMGVTVILACKETTKADQIIEAHKARMDRIQEAYEIAQNPDAESDEVYDQKEIGRDKFIFYCQTVKDFAKLYAPAIAVGTISIGLILWSHGLLRKRYLGVVAAYNALSETFNRYRERVRAEGGKDLDRHYMFGTKCEEITNEVVGEDGKKKKVKETVETVPDGASASEYTRLWAPGETREYQKNPNNALMFLIAQNKYLNNLLQTRGHVFLNEALDALGYNQTPVGAVTGWVKGNKDDYIDFGIYDEENPAVKSFINGRSNVLPLEFNVDGPILELI